MTKVQILLLFSNIWLAQSISDKKFTFGMGLFYLLGAIIMGLLGK
jgi:Co/Zn/Cd efflux system component